MTEMRVTSKGQVTIPKPIRDRLGIFEGAEVSFEEDTDGRVYLVKRDDYEQSLAIVKSVAGTRDSSLSTADIMRMTRGDDWIDVPIRPGSPDLKKLRAILKSHDDRKNAERRTS